MEKRFDVVDYFAGQRAVSKACASKGLRGTALDIEINPKDVTRKMYVAMSQPRTSCNHVVSSASYLGPCA